MNTDGRERTAPGRHTRGAMEPTFELTAGTPRPRRTGAADTTSERTAEAFNPAYIPTGAPDEPDAQFGGSTE